MKSFTMYQVDAFASALFKGNPAAVLYIEEWLPDPLMQSIAFENNLAETAFAVKRPDGSFDLRWFTPVHEAPFCGHATLATAHILATEYDIASPLRFQTLAGELVVTAGQGGNYTLDLPRLDPFCVPEWPETLKKLFDGVAFDMFRSFENYFAVLPDEKAVRTHVPDLGLMAQLHPFGVVITAKGDGTFDFVSRYFAPASGIPEDPVTGSIHATLVPYWAEKLGKTALNAFQASQRGGVLDCELQEKRVVVRGPAVTYMKAEIYLPL